MAAFYNANFKHPRAGQHWTSADFGGKPTVPQDPRTRYTQSVDEKKAIIMGAFGVGWHNGA